MTNIWLRDHIRSLGALLRAAALSMVLVACSQQQMLEKLSSPEDRALARSAIDDLATGRTASLSDKMPAEVRPQLASIFPQMQSALPQGGMTQINLVDASWRSTVATNAAPTRQAFLTYELIGRNQRALARLTIVRSGNTATVTDFYVNPLDRPVAELSAFTLSGKSPSHYIVLGLAVIAFAVTIAALVKLWRGGPFRRRWLWVLGCLVGLGRFSIDWSTGQIAFAPIFVQLFSVGAAKEGALAPWVVSFSIPVLAIYILARRRPAPEQSEPPT